MFDPTLDPTWQQIVTFGAAIWGAFLLRTVLLWMLGLITFWTTRVTALFEAFFAAELLMSGRLVPLALMPEWAQTLAHWLPFESSFGFPITALVGPADGRHLVVGLLRQAAWIAGGFVALQLFWRHAVKHYSAVNG